MNTEKFDMFRNRLVKVYKHIHKQARRQNITCYRVYDHDLPEFPFCIEIYDNHIYLAEYKRRHNLTEEEHEQWLEDCIVIISEILELPSDNVFIKQRQRKAGRLGQYQRVDTTDAFFTVK